MSTYELAALHRLVQKAAERRLQTIMFRPRWHVLTPFERARAIRYHAQMWEYHPAAIAVGRRSTERLERMSRRPGRLIP